MKNSSQIINWENVFNTSATFNDNKPFKFAFIEEFFNRDFYEKLYQTYPKIDDSWIDGQTMNKSQLAKFWADSKQNEPSKEGPDPTLPDVWNEFKLYVESNEFIENFRKYSGVPINKLKYFQFMSYRKGGFQLPHIHNVGPSTLTLMIYFSKDWKQGDPGGTYMATDVDESKIIFEPYNLDNSMALFLDSPHAAHGVRYITKDVERRAIQVQLEEFSLEKGWSGYNPKAAEELTKRKEI